MATTEAIANDKIQDLFDKLEAQKTLLSKCTDLYKTLTSHYTTLLQSVDSKSLTLDSKLQSLDSIHQKSLDDLYERENSIPDRLSSLSSEIESKKQSAIAGLRKPLNVDLPLAEVLKSLCRRMDHSELMRFMMGKRKETTTLRGEMGEAMKECVDPAKMVLETVKEFIEAKASGKKGIADKRWACGVVVSGFFPAEELKGKKNVKAAFARKTVAEAEEVVRDWRQKADEVGDGEGESKMWSGEVAMFLQVVVGFGLLEIFEEEFYKKLVMEYAARRDMPKLAIPIFGDKLPDFIDQLVKNGKEVEAVYFASESGLTERFPPASLLKSCMLNSKKNSTETLKKGNHNADATEEANSFEISHIKAILRCVEDHKLEAVFSFDSLKKRLSLLEKAKADKKKGSAASSKPSNKRAQGSGGPRSGGPRSNGVPPSRPIKRPKYPSYGKRETASQTRSPVSKYLGPYCLSNQTAYDSGLTASTYGPRFDASHVPTGDQITPHYVLSGGSAPSPSAVPQLVNSYNLPGGSAATPNAVHRLGSSYGMPGGGADSPSAVARLSSSYALPGGSAPTPSAEPLLGNSYGLQSVYGAYDYSATTTSSYQPPYA